MSRKPKPEYIVRWETYGLPRGNSTTQSFATADELPTVEEVERASKRLAEIYKDINVYYKVFVGKIDWSEIGG